MSNPGLYLLQDGTHADPGACAPDNKGALRHTESGLAVCLYEDGTPQTVGQDAINNMNLAAATAADPDASPKAAEKPAKAPDAPAPKAPLAVAPAKPPDPREAPKPDPKFKG
jgi:hypothetical protein